MMQIILKKNLILLIFYENNSKIIKIFSEIICTICRSHSKKEFVFCFYFVMGGRKIKKDNIIVYII